MYEDLDMPILKDCLTCFCLLGRILPSKVKKFILSYHTSELETATAIKLPDKQILS